MGRRGSGNTSAPENQEQETNQKTEKELLEELDQKTGDSDGGSTAGPGMNNPVEVEAVELVPASEPVVNTLQMTYDWFQTARPSPNDFAFQNQVGVHFEEVAEMLDEMSGADALTVDLIQAARKANRLLADHLKASSQVVMMIEEGNQEMFLDALCDQVVTATGTAQTRGHKFVGAMDEVNRGNYSKFVDGKAVFDQTGKIAKGPDYKKADLKPYL